MTLAPTCSAISCTQLAACLRVFLGAYQSALQQDAAAGVAKGKSKGTTAAGKGGKAGKANSKQAEAKSTADSKTGKGGKAAKDSKVCSAWCTSNLLTPLFCADYW